MSSPFRWQGTAEAQDHVAADGPTPQSRLLVLRALLVVICAALASLLGPFPKVLYSVAALAATAAIVSVPARLREAKQVQPFVEAVLAAAVAATAAAPEPFLLYLAAPALAAGFSYGAGWAIGTTTAAELVLFAVGRFRFSGDELRDYLVAITEWTMLCIAIGLLGTWVRRLRAAPSFVGGEAADPSYVAAYRLLSQLRLVSRQLSGGLDPVSLAEGLLERLFERLEFRRGILYVGSGGDHLIPLAARGTALESWDANLGGESIFAEAWASDVPILSATGIDGTHRTVAAILPLRMGVRTFGLVALEDVGGGVPELAEAMRTVEETALRLETALLFAEVRTLATAEERRRLAREIHDGIAQELASLGYRIDDAAANSTGPVRSDLLDLRADVTRLVGELRLSIFDLRSDVSSSAGLGSVLSEYVQQMGAGSGLTMHLVLDESAQRLRVDIETELLRIAQEAVTNVRKHAGAENIWVTCRVQPPDALLVVEDDGVGLGTARADSFGLDIMRERARRIGARLDVHDRTGGGTAVEVRLGSSPAAQPRARSGAGEERT